MINWLKDRLQRPQDSDQAPPFAGEAGLADFLAGLPQGQPLACLTTLADALGALNHWSLTTARRIELVTAIEEAAQKPRRMAWHMLFPGQDDARLNEAAVAALTGYYDSLISQTSGLATDLLAAKTEDSAGAALIVATLLNALGRRAVMLRMQLNGVGAEFWAEVENAVRQVAALRVVQQPVWRGPLRGQTCGRLLVRILAFEAAPLDAMRPTQVWAFYQVVRHLEQQISYTSTAPQSHAFVVELAQGRGPRRWRGEQPAPHSRYLSLARAHASLVRLLVAAGTERALPQWMGAGECSAHSYIRMIVTVLRAWGAETPQRRHQRERKEIGLLVQHGFAQARRLVAAAGFAHVENKRERARLAAASSSDQPKSTLDILGGLETGGGGEQMERWRLEDVSERGFGALPQAGAEWIRAGTLLAFRQHDVPRWNLAIIRRTGAARTGGNLVGAEVLRGAAALARVSVLPPRASQAAAGAENAEDAIWIDSEPPCLVLPAHSYAAGATAMMFMDGASYAITLSDPIEIGDDYAACVVTPPPSDLTSVHHARNPPRSRFLSQLLSNARNSRARTGT